MVRTNEMLIGLVVAAVSLCLASGCREQSQTPNGVDDDHGHSHDDGHGHSGDDHDHEGHGHGALVPLGEATIGAFTVIATRDEGQVDPGGDAAVDVTVAPAADASGPGATVAVVRLWIGTEDAKGSVKARAEVEDPNEPNRWHTHVEAPSPLPDGSRLWVEIEDESGGRSTGSFDLRA